MVTFVLSIAITCFDVQGVSQRVITGVIWLFIFLLIGWAVATGWMDSTGASDQDQTLLSNNQSIEDLSGNIKARIEKLTKRKKPPSRLERTGSMSLKAISGTNLGG